MILTFRRGYETAIIDVAKDGRKPLAIIAAYLKTGYHLIEMENHDV